MALRFDQSIRHYKAENLVKGMFTFRIPVSAVDLPLFSGDLLIYFFHMPKKFKVSEIRALLEYLSRSTGESLDHYGLGVISDKMNEIVSHKYLYENLLKATERTEDDSGELSLSPSKIDDIAHYLGFKNFNDFVESLEKPIDPVLQALTGDYYSYVRKNSMKTSLLQSPVKIYRAGNSILLRLKGPRWEYKGELTYIDGCLFCLMRSDVIGKSFHHVYKIGKIKQPQVLMGIFSGVSSSNDPIGGRCLLVRQHIDFHELENKMISEEELICSGSDEELRLVHYFKDFQDNNLRINNPYGFDFDDLV